jgi:hypothetical protein
MRSSLYWGDNVVWVWEGSESHQQLFYDAIAQRRDDFGAAGYVAVSSDPAEITARWPWIEILDARAGAPITSPRQLLEAIHQFCTRAPRPLLLFDSLAPMADRWGMRIASGFFGHCCPMLLDLGAIAYWSMPGASPYRTMHREIEQITQCIIVVGEGRLRISKAEGRPPGAQGQLFRYSVKDGRLQLQPAQAAARVGAALRPPPAPGSKPERSRPPRRGLPKRYLPSGAGRKRALPRDADGPFRASQRHPRRAARR